MNNDVLKNIRKNNIKRFFTYLIPVAIIDIVVTLLIYEIFTNEFEIASLIIIIPMGIFAYFLNGVLFDYIRLAINPLKDNVFKKYGSPEKISEILKEIENTKEYEDKNIIISKNYICDKKDYNKIVALNNALGVHKYIHKRNFVIDYYKVIVIDKYGENIDFQYSPKEEELVDKVLIILSQKCQNAEIGYTKNEFDHVNKNKVDLPGEISEDNNEYKVTFKSEEQKKKEYIENVNRLNATKKILKCIGIAILSIMISDGMLLLILGDNSDIEGTRALALVGIVAILIFALLYYVLIKRKEKNNSDKNN